MTRTKLISDLEVNIRILKVSFFRKDNIGMPTEKDPG